MSPTQFGWLFVPIVSGLILGSAVTGKLAGRVRPLRLVGYGFSLMALGAVLNLTSNLWLPQRVPWAVLPLTIYTFGFALVVPVLTILSLDLFPERKGLASSLQGFSQTVIFAGISGMIAPLVYRSGPKHAFGLTAMMTISWLAYRGYHKSALRAERAVTAPHRSF